MNTVTPREYLPPNPRAAFIYNPVSGGAARAQEQLQELEQRGLITPQNVYTTVPGGIAGNREGLQKHILTGVKDPITGETHPYDVVVNMGGDGIGNLIVNIFAADPELHEVPMLDAGNGGANDGHLADFRPGELDLANLGGLPIVARRPIRIETTSPDGRTNVHFAARYKTIGFTAEAAAGFNKPNRRAMRRKWPKIGQRALSGLVVFGSMFKDSSFTVTEQGKSADLNKTRTIGELAVVNTRRMAGFELGTDDGRSDTFQILVSRSKAGFMIKALMHKGALRKAWEEREELDIVVAPRRGRKDRPIHSQSGGEEELLAPGTRLRMTKHTRPLYYAVGYLAAT